MIPKSFIICLSGGLDSTTLLYQLHGEGHSLHALLVDYKAPHNANELNFAKLHCHRLGVLFTTIELPSLGGLTEANWVVGNRNAILCSLAVNLAIQAKAEAVVVGFNKDDEADFPDCRQAFLQVFNLMLTTAEVNVEVCAPYLEWPKWKIAGLAREIGVPMHEIWTCYKGGAKPCGKCPACLKLKAALEK